MSHPENVQSTAEKLIDFFKEMPAQNDLPEGIFDDLIIALKNDPEKFIVALINWLASERDKR